MSKSNCYEVESERWPCERRIDDDLLLSICKFLYYLKKYAFIRIDFLVAIVVNLICQVNDNGLCRGATLTIA